MLSINLFRLLMKIYTPLKYRQERFTQWLYSWIPSYLFQVLYIPEQSMDMHEIYNASNGSHWSKHAPKEFKSGFYLFQFWNSNDAKIERILLHSEHLKTALQMTQLDLLWMMDEEALLIRLMEYIKSHKKRIEMIDLYLNKKTIFKNMKSYHLSLGLPYNWTPRLVYLLSQCEEHHSIDEKMEDLQVLYFTWDLEECIKTDDEFLVIG